MTSIDPLCFRVQMKIYYCDVVFETKLLCHFPQFRISGLSTANHNFSSSLNMLTNLCSVPSGQVFNCFLLFYMHTVHQQQLR